MQNDIEFIDTLLAIIEVHGCSRLVPLIAVCGGTLALAPAGQTIHHNFDGGLVRHIVEMIQFGLPITKKLLDASGNQVINTEEFINVCILHDLAKLEFYRKEGELWSYVKHPFVLQEMVVQNLCAKHGIVLTENEINALWLAEGGYSPVYKELEKTELAHLLHMADLFSSQLLRPRMVSDAVCPKCGGALVRRNGATGAFWGCSKYPECKHTTNIMPAMRLEERQYA